MPGQIVAFANFSPSDAAALRADLIAYFQKEPIKQVEFYEAVAKILQQGIRPVPQRPVSTINRLFTSAARSYRERVIGVILSGLLRDGTAGLRAVHNAGGLTVVQDPREAEYPDMPTNAMEGLNVTFCLNLAEIGPALELLVRRTTRFETGLEVSVRKSPTRHPAGAWTGSSTRDSGFRSPETRQPLGGRVR